MSSLFDAVEMAPRDPILGLNEQFLADTNPAKVNLGVGVYTDENGKLPLLACVRAAESMLVEAAKPRGYLPIDGIAAYDELTQTLVFGADSLVKKAGRIATVQAVGGTGGLKVGADLLKRMQPDAKVLISDPSWENHRALFEGAGFVVEHYPYYDAARHGIDFDAMRRALEAAAPGSIVVLHACCHNPTGCDLTPEQWSVVVATLASRRLVPFLDMAYQGFGDGIAEDGRAIGLCLAAGLDCFVATSFSEKLLALRRARRRPLRGLRQRRCREARPEPAQARHSQQLLEPADAWRRRRRPGARHAIAAGDVGRRARRHARAHQAHALRAAAESSSPPAPTSRPRSSPASAACSATRACRRHRCSACEASSGFMASTRGASASRRSTTATSTPWSTPSPK